MKSPLGQTVRQWAGVFALFEDRTKAEEMAHSLRETFKAYKIYVIDLKGDRRLRAIDLDPDLADFKEGYAVIIEAEGT